MTADVLEVSALPEKGEKHRVSKSDVMDRPSDVSGDGEEPLPSAAGHGDGRRRVRSLGMNTDITRVMNAKVNPEFCTRNQQQLLAHAAKISELSSKQDARHKHDHTRVTPLNNVIWTPRLDSKGGPNWYSSRHTPAGDGAEYFPRHGSALQKQDPPLREEHGRQPLPEDGVPAVSAVLHIESHRTHVQSSGMWANAFSVYSHAAAMSHPTGHDTDAREYTGVSVTGHGSSRTHPNTPAVHPQTSVLQPHSQTEHVNSAPVHSDSFGVLSDSSKVHVDSSLKHPACPPPNTVYTDSMSLHPGPSLVHPDSSRERSDLSRDNVHVIMPSTHTVSPPVFQDPSTVHKDLATAHLNSPYVHLNVSNALPQPPEIQPHSFMGYQNPHFAILTGRHKEDSQIGRSSSAGGHVQSPDTAGRDPNLHRGHANFLREHPQPLQRERPRSFEPLFPDASRDIQLSSGYPRHTQTSKGHQENSQKRRPRSFEGILESSNYPHISGGRGDPASQKHHAGASRKRQGKSQRGRPKSFEGHLDLNFPYTPRIHPESHTVSSESSTGYQENTLIIHPEPQTGQAVPVKRYQEDPRGGRPDSFGGDTGSSRHKASSRWHRDSQDHAILTRGHQQGPQRNRPSSFGGDPGSPRYPDSFRRHSGLPSLCRLRSESSGHSGSLEQTSSQRLRPDSFREFGISGHTDFHELRPESSAVSGTPGHKDLHRIRPDSSREYWIPRPLPRGSGREIPDTLDAFDIQPPIPKQVEELKAQEVRDSPNKREIRRLVTGLVGSIENVVQDLHDILGDLHELFMQIDEVTDKIEKQCNCKGKNSSSRDGSLSHQCRRETDGSSWFRDRPRNTPRRRHRCVVRPNAHKTQDNPQDVSSSRDTAEECETDLKEKAARSPEQASNSSLSRRYGSSSLSRRHDGSDSLSRKRDGSNSLSRRQNRSGSLSRRHDENNSLSRRPDGRDSLSRSRDSFHSLSRRLESTTEQICRTLETPTLPPPVISFRHVSEDAELGFEDQFTHGASASSYFSRSFEKRGRRRGRESQNSKERSDNKASKRYSYPCGSRAPPRQRNSYFRFSDSEESIPQLLSASTPKDPTDFRFWDDVSPQQQKFITFRGGGVTPEGEKFQLHPSAETDHNGRTEFTPEGETAFLLQQTTNTGHFGRTDFSNFSDENPHSVQNPLFHVQDNDLNTSAENCPDTILQNWRQKTEQNAGSFDSLTPQMDWSYLGLSEHLATSNGQSTDEQGATSGIYNYRHGYGIQPGFHQRLVAALPEWKPHQHHLPYWPSSELSSVKSSDDEDDTQLGRCSPGQIHRAKLPRKSPGKVSPLVSRRECVVAKQTNKQILVTFCEPHTSQSETDPHPMQSSDTEVPEPLSHQERTLLEGCAPGGPEGPVAKTTNSSCHSEYENEMEHCLENLSCDELGSSDFSDVDPDVGSDLLERSVTSCDTADVSYNRELNTWKSYTMTHLDSDDVVSDCASDILNENLHDQAKPNPGFDDTTLQFDDLSFSDIVY